MSKDLTTLPPEDFLRLAVNRGGLDLDAVAEGLSPEAADALRRIAAPIPPPPGSTVRSASVRSIKSDPAPARLKCPACGRLNRPRDRFCRRCGQQLDTPAPPVTLDDLVVQGRLTPEQAQELQSFILFHQSHYTAGTRYSVFGGVP